MKKITQFILLAIIIGSIPQLLIDPKYATIRLLSYFAFGLGIMVLSIRQFKECRWNGSLKMFGSIFTFIAGFGAIFYAHQTISLWALPVILLMAYARGGHYEKYNHVHFINDSSRSKDE